MTNWPNDKGRIIKKVELQQFWSLTFRIGLERPNNLKAEYKKAEL